MDNILGRLGLGSSDQSSQKLLRAPHGVYATRHTSYRPPPPGSESPPSPNPPPPPAPREDKDAYPQSTLSLWTPPPLFRQVSHLTLTSLCPFRMACSGQTTRPITPTAPSAALLGGVDRAPWLDPPPPPKRAQLTGPPKSCRDSPPGLGGDPDPKVSTKRKMGFLESARRGGSEKSSFFFCHVIGEKKIDQGVKKIFRTFGARVHNN